MRRRISIPAFLDLSPQFSFPLPGEGDSLGGRPISRELGESSQSKRSSNPESREPFKSAPSHSRLKGGLFFCLILLRLALSLWIGRVSLFSVSAALPSVAVIAAPGIVNPFVGAGDHLGELGCDLLVGLVHFFLLYQLRQLKKLFQLLRLRKTKKVFQ